MLSGIKNSEEYVFGVSISWINWERRCNSRCLRGCIGPVFHTKPNPVFLWEQNMPEAFLVDKKTNTNQHKGRKNILMITDNIKPYLKKSSCYVR